MTREGEEYTGTRSTAAARWSKSGLAKLHEPDAKIQRYRAPDSLLDFLKTLRL